MIVTRTATYAVCPYCGKDAGQIDHLLGRTVNTAWYCQSCGERYALAFAADRAVEIAKMPGRKVTTLDLLVLRPQGKPVYFVVKGMRFEDQPTVGDLIAFNVAHLQGDTLAEIQTSVVSPSEEHEHKRFFYEEHSCPTNWLEPEMVSFDGDADPHGLIEFVAFIDEAALPPDADYGPNDRDAALEAFIEQHKVAV